MLDLQVDEIVKGVNVGEYSHIYLVGGAVRDALLGKSTYDRDIAIKGAEKFAHKIAEKFGGTFIVLDEVNHIYRVVLPDKINYLDISEIQGETIEEDLMRRDFTINAIAYDLMENRFVDVTGGIEDLKNGVLRHIKDENFADDPLRILRAFRFAAVTGFEMTPELEAAIKKYLFLALNPAPERINYELMKLFGGGGKCRGKCRGVEENLQGENENLFLSNGEDIRRTGGGSAAETLLKLDEFCLLEKIFPWVDEMKRVTPNSHHHLDLFHHVIETVRQIEIAYEEASPEIKEHLDSVDFGGFPRINHLKLAGFLHDIGKFSTWTIETTGRHRFIKHDDVGSKMVVPLLREWKFSKKQIEYISSMIKNHIYPSGVLAAPDLNEKVMMRYIRKMGDNVIDNIILARADRLSARGIDVTDEMVKSNLDGLNKLLNFYLEKRETLAPLPKLLDGKEIMSILNISPSPMLGKIVEALKEAQLNGDVNTKEEAECFVKGLSYDN